MTKNKTLANELKQRANSFKHAANGIRCALSKERNMQIHCACSVLALILAIILRLDANDWRWLLLAIALVWIAELLNTAIEALCDVVSPGFHPGIKQAKDVAAGAVLICAGGAMALGCMVFLPQLQAVLR